MLEHRDALFVRDAVTDAVVAAFSLLVRDQSNGVKLEESLVYLKHEVIKAVNARISRWERSEELYGQADKFPEP